MVLRVRIEKIIPFFPKTGTGYWEQMCIKSEENYKYFGMLMIIYLRAHLSVPRSTKVVQMTLDTIFKILYYFYFTNLNLFNNVKIDIWS